MFDVISGVCSYLFHRLGLFVDWAGVVPVLLYLLLRYVSLETYVKKLAPYLVCSSCCWPLSGLIIEYFKFVRNVTLVMFLGAEVRWQLIATCVTKKERYQSFIVCNGHALLNHLIVCASVNT